MFKEKKRVLGFGFRLLDVILIACAFWAAYCLRFEGKYFVLTEINLEFQVLLFGHIICWSFFSQIFGIYKSKRFINLLPETWDLVKTIVSSIIVALTPAFFLRDFPISRLFLIYLSAFEIACLFALRLTLRKTLKYIRLRGYNYRQILIVGRNKRSEAFLHELLRSPELGIKILGFIDAPLPNESTECFNCSVAGDLENLENILRQNVVDELIVTLPLKSFYQEISDIIALCEKIGVNVKLPTDLFNKRIAKSGIANFCNLEVIDFYTTPKMDSRIVLKRVIDVFVSGVIIVIFMPIFIAISLAIKLTSEGPIIFSQRRIGYNGRLFNCLKFRTMVNNAENLKRQLKEENEMDGPVFKIKNDPRITSFGRFLRQTSLDELPQLINVIKGDMSLVGPRPPIPEEVDQYKITDLRRLSMRPGITCTWQVSGRNRVSFEVWMEMDRQYIDQWSLLLDLKILIKTIPAIILQRGAH